MTINTRHFGDIEIDDKGIIDFVEGLPAFEEYRRYVLLKDGDESSPFRWLQCIDNADLAFAIVDPFAVKKDYEVELSPENIKLLGIEKAEDVATYSIVVVPEDASKISMNLKAPIIINIKSNMGKQVILDTDKYGVRHYILEELRRQEVAGNVGADKEEGPVDSNK